RLHPRASARDHVVLGPELQAGRRAGLDARRLETDADPVHAERALRHLARLLMELRHVEGASRLAVAAADALRGVDVHDPVRVLHDRARRGAGGEAPGILAVHALVLAHQPGEALV